MKVFPVEKIRELDSYTIEQDGIRSIELMERASRVFTNYFKETFPSTDRPVLIFAGTGNNGGDGLAVARLLHRDFHEVSVYITRFSGELSPDCSINLQRLPQRGIEITEIHKGDALPKLPEHAIIIDAMFGSGLSRPIAGYWAELVEHLNASGLPIISIDMPSGVFADKPTTSPSIRARYTLSFQLPKQAFFYPENEQRIGSWEVRPIGLSDAFLSREQANVFFLEKNEIQRLTKPRKKHAHKGDFGHALLICGSHTKVGAAILAARACLRSGTGLLTCHIPRFAHPIMHISLPEAMVSPDPHEHVFSTVPELQRFNSIGIGCGLGTNTITAQALRFLLDATRVPMVLDADALNILAHFPKMLKLIPPYSILTPHPGEFERLFGKTNNGFERHDLQIRKSNELNCIIVLKGAFTCITTPEGKAYYNSTGNPGMATGGSGDALTGVLTSLLAQGYRAEDAARIGVFVHGLAGDIASKSLEHEALIAGDIIEHLGDAFHQIKSDNL